MEFRNDIQGLRALAVLFVFIFHLSSSSLPGGFIGVDMFFVISGYLISKIVLSKLKENKFSLLQFYISRIKRIVPAYFFLLIAIYISFLFIYLSADLGMFRKAYFWTFLFLSNNYFMNLDDYFGATSSENPFLHTWTLAIEMQFYLLLPILLLLVRKIKILTWTLVTMIVVLIGYSTYEILIGNKSNMYYSLLSRSPEFLVGVLLSIMRLEENKIIKEHSTLLTCLGLLGLGACIFFLHDSSPFPGATSLLPCLSVGIILISPNNFINVKILSQTALKYVGKISYSIYLWHWPIMAFYRYHNNRYTFTFNESITIIFLTVVASLLSYYVIEKKMRRLNGYSFYIPVTVMAVGNIVMIYTSVTVKNRVSNIPIEYTAPQFGMDSHGKYFKKVGIHGDNHTDEKRIVLLGDSHALTFKPYLDELGKSNFFSFRTVTNNNIPTIPFLTRKEIPQNDRWNIYKQLSPYIKNEVDSADVIIILFSNAGSRWVSPLQKMFANLKGHQKVLVLPDYPSIDRHPVRVNKSHLKDKNKDQRYKLTYKVTDSQIINLINSNPNVRYVDFSKFKDFFSDAPFYNDTLMYYDKSHLNYFGSVKYAKYSGSEFMKNLKWALEE